MFVLSDSMTTWRRSTRHAFIGVLGVVSLFFLLYLYLEEKQWSWNPLFPALQWQEPGAYDIAYPRNYTFIIDNTPVCKNTTPFLLLVVPVAPRGRAAREAIRKTWGSQKQVLGHPVETLFMLGLSGGADAAPQQEELWRESRRYRDLIQSDFLDSYHNLTIKTMMILEWVTTNCFHTSYMMKVDSDVFLQVENLMGLLLDPSTAAENYISGLVSWHNQVLRNPFSKFYMPRHVVPEPEYPPYILGMSYVMSMDLPAKILEVSLQIKPVFIEDVYLGMCLKRLGIPPTEPPDKTLFLVDPRYPLSSCRLSKLIATTTRSTKQIFAYWQSSREAEAKCRNT